MKRLYLLRHARAGRSQGPGQDYDRPLSPEGRGEAARLAARMRAEGFLPRTVLYSGAERARETWDILNQGLSTEDAEPIPAATRDDLYLATAGHLLKTLHGLPDESDSALLVGHNPGMQELAAALAGPGSREEMLRILRRDYPSAGLAVFHFDVEDWSEIDSGNGRLRYFLHPADLVAED